MAADAPVGPPRSARLALAAFVVVVALGAVHRRDPRLPDGLLVEVVGDVPRPGVHLVDTPTLAVAVTAAGGPDAGPDALIGGSRVAVSATASVGPAHDPLLLGHRIDVNVQGATVLQDLPGVGPSIAGAILDRRLRQGPFRSVDELARVRGIGPATLAEIAPLVTVGDVPPPVAPGPLDVNAATAAQLDRLPGIGPTRAAAILADRLAHGPYADVADLDRVPGIGPATVAALAPLAVALPGATP